MNHNAYCLKIGGSVITDKAVPYKAKKKIIRAIAKSLVSLQTPLIISHGVGSFAHTSAVKYGGKKGYKSRWGIAKVARDAQEINRIVMDIFIEEGLPAISFSPRGFFLTKKEKVAAYFFDPIREVVRQGLIPVIHGDGILDTVQKTTIFSGEKSLNLLIRSLKESSFKITTIIQLCDVDGLLDQNNNFIPEVTKKNWKEVRKYIHEMHVADVTGGMEHKVTEALKMTELGIETWIMNGTTDDFSGFLKGKSVRGTVIR